MVKPVNKEDVSEFQKGNSDKKVGSPPPAASQGVGVIKLVCSIPSLVWGSCTYKLILIIFIFTSAGLFGKINDLKSEEKLELINKLFANPDDYKNIIIKTLYYMLN